MSIPGILNVVYLLEPEKEVNSSNVTYDILWDVRVGNGIWSIPAIKRDEAKDYKKAMDSLTDHFKVRKKMLRWERDNQVRDRVISYIQDKNLRAKLYCEETLTLSKLMEIASRYHDKEALILIHESQVNQISSDTKKRRKVLAM